MMKNNHIEGENKELAINEIKQLEKKIKSLVKENFAKSFNNLYQKNIYAENIELIDKGLAKQFKKTDEHQKLIEKSEQLLKYDFNHFMKYENNKIAKGNSYSRIQEELYTSIEDVITDNITFKESSISISLTKSKFKINSTSKSHLYSQQVDFESILDDYVKKGLCVSKHTAKSDKIKYQAIGENGKYKGYISYNKKWNNGEWSTGMWSSINDLKQIKKDIELVSKEFGKSIIHYYRMVTEKIIKKYTPKTKQEFGNEF